MAAVASLCRVLTFTRISGKLRDLVLMSKLRILCVSLTGALSVWTGRLGSG